MAIKRFCDCCEREITQSYTSERLSFSTVVHNKRVQVEVMAGTGDGWNGGDLCLDCLYLALDTHDQRLKDSP